MTISINPNVDSNLLATLLAEESDAPVRVGNADRFIALPAADEMEQTGRAILEASIALLTGHVQVMACGGQGRVWRVEWNAGFDPNGPRYVGVLESYMRRFFTTAPDHEACRGFAAAAHGLAFANPQTRFDGAWATLLATFAVEDTAALTAARLTRVRASVLKALELDTTGESRKPIGTEAEGPRWTLKHVATANGLPGLSGEPVSLQRGRRRACVDGLVAVFSDFAAFTTVSAEWCRTREPFVRGRFVGPQVHDTLVALHAGQHLVLIGPPGEGKTLCAEQAVAAAHDKDVTSAVVPSIPLDMFDIPARLLGYELPEGPFRSGPLHAALMAADGAGSALHVSCDEDIPAALVPLLRAVVTKNVLPPDPTLGSPMTPIGRRFRLVVEVSRILSTELPPNLSAALDGRGNVSTISFDACDERQSQLLLHDVAKIDHAALIFLISHVVGEVRRAFASGKLVRGVSSAEVIAWAHMTVTMNTHGSAGDLPALLERAAMSGWVRAIPGAEVWWKAHAPLAKAESQLRHRLATNALPASPIDWDRGQSQESAWYRHEELRRTVDEITAVVYANAPITLIPTRGPTDDGVRDVPRPLARDAQCQVYLERDGSSLDAFVEVVQAAARERGRARWGYEEPEPSNASLVPIIDIVESFRIDRLLDGLDDAHLQRYRRRAAAQICGQPLDLSGSPIELLATVLPYLSAQYTVTASADMAVSAVLELIEPADARRGYIEAMLRIVQSIATTPSNMDVFNQTLYTLADFTGRGA